jgi:hypothetical protein
MKVTGTRKLPSRMMVGIRLALPVAMVTSTAADHSTRPLTNIGAQLGTLRGRPVLVLAMVCPGLR